MVSLSAINGDAVTGLRKSCLSQLWLHAAVGEQDWLRLAYVGILYQHVYLKERFACVSLLQLLISGNRAITFVCQ